MSLFGPVGNLVVVVILLGVVVFAFAVVTVLTLFVFYFNFTSFSIRLTALGLELRKQSQELSEAQHVVIQERVKNEQLRSDISEFHAEASKNGARLDTAAMQLHMAKKRQVNAERNMAMSRQRLGRMAASKTVAATKSAVAHKPDYSSYPQAPQRSEVSGMGGLKNTAAVISAMKTASSRSTIQKELVRIEEEFEKRSMGRNG